MHATLVLGAFTNLGAPPAAEVGQHSDGADALQARAPAREARPRASLAKPLGGGEHAREGEGGAGPRGARHETHVRALGACLRARASQACGPSPSRSLLP